MTVTHAAIATHLGIARPQATIYVGQGMPRSSLEAAEAWYRANVNQRVRPGQSLESVPDYQESRARREAAEAEMAELKLRQQQGQLIDAAGVRAEFAKQVSAVREGLLNIPARLAPLLAAESEVTAVQSMLDRELRGVLAQFVGEAA